MSQVCELNNDNPISKSISNAEKRKNQDYSGRIKPYLGCDFIPCLFTSGGGIGLAARKSINITVNKLASTTMDRVDDIKTEIRTDTAVSLLSP